MMRVRYVSDKTDVEPLKYVYPIATYVQLASKIKPKSLTQRKETSKKIILRICFLSQFFRKYHSSVA